MSALLASSFVGRVAAFKATKVQVRNEFEFFFGFFFFFFFFFFASSSVCVARRSRGGNTHHATAGMDRYDETRMMIHARILLWVSSTDRSRCRSRNVLRCNLFRSYRVDGRTTTDDGRVDARRRERSVENSRHSCTHHTVRSFVSGKPPVDGFGGSDLCMSKQYVSWIENIYRVQWRFCHRWHHWMDGFFHTVCTCTISLDPFGCWMDAPPPRGVVCSILIWID